MDTRESSENRNQGSRPTVRTTKNTVSTDDQITEEDTGWKPREAAPVEPRSKTDPTKWPAVSMVFAVLAPPVGAVLGHISLRRTFWRRGLSWTAVVLGWVLTLVLAGGFLAWDGDRRAQEATDARVAQADAQTREIIESTESFGKVDAQFCDDLKVAANLTPPTGFVTQPDEVTPELIAAYATLGESSTPHAAAYTAYATHLEGFGGASEDAKMDEANKMVAASTDDVYACLPLVDERFADMN